ncbi:MAG: phosphoribosylglycinamide formyltransferase [Bdellovibrionales bacterium]|nr:phosphoribosylglycinamide formyltransferase [Bdellovibrionales bacterium]
MDKANVAIFLSGQGTNFESLAQACESGELHANVSVVFSNQTNAPGLVRASQRNIPTICIPHFSPRSAFEQKILDALGPYPVDWIVLCGYMRILSSHFLSQYPSRVINIHPSLLPAYPGIGAIKRAFEAKEKRIGVTVHYVDAGVDTGEVIMQETIEVLPSDTLQSVEEKVHKLEHRVYKKAIASLLG